MNKYAWLLIAYLTGTADVSDFKNPMKQCSSTNDSKRWSAAT